MTDRGKLYIVATPIGNLGDMTYRAIETLRNVSLIAAEDTRKTKGLLTHYGISTRLISYFEHNEAERSEEIVEILKKGEDVALVSEAGTPSISDPGYRLISGAVENGIVLVPVPGATAAAAALSVSGLPTDRFLFVGFLPDKVGKRKKRLEELRAETATLVFYISKWKLEKTLADMADILGDRRACYCRELTKMHEEIKYLRLPELARFVSEKPVKGEITLVVEGACIKS